MSSGVLAVIPARMGSTRLPRKPLADIAGRSLIERVWRNVSGSGVAERIVVATDHPEIAARVRGIGGIAVMTDPDHPSGTDRVAEAVERPEFADAQVVLNVQGDEPFLSAGALSAAVSLVRNEGWEAGTLATRFDDAADWRDPSRVKVVRADDGGALYFSRAPIPHHRDDETDGPALETGVHLRHVGVYSYRRDALLRWVSLPEHPLERLERLEQLRPLAAGIRIGVAEAAADPAGIDTHEDVERAVAYLAGRESPKRNDRP